MSATWKIAFLSIKTLPKTAASASRFCGGILSWDFLDMGMKVSICHSELCEESGCLVPRKSSGQTPFDTTICALIKYDQNSFFTRREPLSVSRTSYPKSSSSFRKASDCINCLLALHSLYFESFSAISDGNSSVFLTISKPSV